MIALKASASDDNPAGTSGFVGIPQPAGVDDGDVIVVAIALPDTDIEVTAPDEEWTRVRQTDKAQPLGIVVFWRIALNEPTTWVFALSAETEAIGAALIYAGVDGFVPIEADAAALTAAAATHNVPPITAAVDAEELAVFLAAADAGSYTPAAGFDVAVSKSQAGACRLEAHRRQLQFAGAISASTRTFSTSVRGACVALVLRPSVGMSSIDDVRRRVLAQFPEGAEDLLDLEPGGDYYNFFQAIATELKFSGFDLVDILRQERIVRRSRYKLPDWERVFALATSRLALTGTIPQRQAQIVSAFRSAAGQGSSAPEVQGALAPLLGYNDGNAPEVVRCDRSALRLLHSYQARGSNDVSVSASSTVTLVFHVKHDGGVVSSAGARLTLLFSDPDLSEFEFELTAPDGTSKAWDRGWNHAPIELYGLEFAGARVQGAWTLVVTNNSASPNTYLAGSTLFVEGVAPGQDTGAAIFHWAAYADPAHVGESGVAGDFDAANRAISKLAQAHTVAGVRTVEDAIPDTAAMPDRCVPT